jgi:glycosyltransferase involved in cell wall biosynthesis
VVPLFNEEGNVRLLYNAIREAMGASEYSWEVVFVDDGSRDSTFEILRELHASEEDVHVVRFRRNFGQTAAMAAGLAASRGDVLVTMDGDLQNDPRDSPRLVEKLDEGYDVAAGWRVDRQDPFLNRRLPSKIANWMISTITGVYLHDYGCTLKALRREIARELALYGEMHRFIPALAANIGARIAEVNVRHHPRRHGKSKYGIGRTFRVVLDLITVKFLSGFSTRPSHLFGVGGMAALLTGGGIVGYMGIERIFFNVGLADRPLLLLGILLIASGLQFLTMGLIGEILCRIYYESQGKPTYVVRESLAARTAGMRGLGTETAEEAVDKSVVGRREW